MAARAASPAGAGPRMQIGEAASRAGLSIRTLRHYEEAGLVVPSGRSEGRFRLYTEKDVARLRVVRRMKPLGFTLEEMRDLLGVLDELGHGPDRTDRAGRDALLDRLAMFHEAAQARVRALREQLDTAEDFAGTLREELDRAESAGAGRRSPRP